MEEQGMERRRRFFRARLLILLSLVFFTPAVSHNAGLWAQEGESVEGENAEQETPEEEAPKPLTVRLETSAGNPIANNAWSIFVLINHPYPSEVNVAPPRFPPTLILERVRTETRMLRRDPPPEDGSPQSDRWTRVEFLFTPLRAGTISLEPFTVTVPGRRQTTEKLTIRFRERVQTVRRYTPRYRWQSPPSSAEFGKKTEFLLELSSWEPEKDAPKGIFRERMPLNAILEESPPERTGTGSFRYTIGIIPLEGNTVAIEPFSFQSEGYDLSIPGVSVAVRIPPPVEEPAPRAGTLPPAPGEAKPAETPKTEIPKISFEENRGKVFSLLRGEYDRIIARVESLWNEGGYALALVEIRRNERNSLIGPSLIPVRRGMERALSLGFTRDEPWHPLKIPLVSWVVIAFAVIIFAATLFVFRPGLRVRKESSSSRRRGGLITIIVTVLSISLALIVLVEGLGNYFPLGRLSSPKNAAVLRSTSAFRVPDPKGAVNAQFGEGQPVIIGDYRGEWCYAESPDGRSGWVPWRTVITY